MAQSRNWKRALSSDLGVLSLFALGWFVLFMLINGQYGFHRDELAFLDDGLHLEWGFVSYPPLTPFIARVAWTLFGPSLVGLRLFAALAVCIAVVLTGLMARELGGGRRAQLLAASATIIAPMALSHASLFMYKTFDYLWWVLAAYLMIRLLKSGDARWWLGIGAAIGLGMMTKYTMPYLVMGIVAGVLFTPVRRYLRSPWLWAGAGLALLIWLPNIIWQAQHGFIALDFLTTIHARDVRIGRTSSFLFDQFYQAANIVTIPLWVAGLWYYLTGAERRYQPLAWMFLIPFGLFLATQGRGYYMAPAYPMLLAAGACRASAWLDALSGRRRIAWRNALYNSLAIGGVLVVAITLPLAPLNSTWWKVADAVNEALREQVGWPEFVMTIANIRDGLSTADRAHLGILAANYGEAGALNLYGPAYGLPTPISGVNSFWQRGYGNPPPDVLIVAGLSPAQAGRLFESCTVAGHVTNRYGILNEETRYHPDVLVCHNLRQPWPVFWQSFHSYG
jgi:4-amino-4-deoxy-L-arabinose transferase-like glycosyltransferase